MRARQAPSATALAATFAPPAQFQAAISPFEHVGAPLRNVPASTRLHLPPQKKRAKVTTVPTMQNGHSHSSLLADALIGAAAGGAAVFIMDRVDWFLHQNEDATTRMRIKAVRPGGMDPAHVFANRVADTLGYQLTPPQPNPAGIATHYLLGIVPGMIYAMLHERLPAIGFGRGSIFGLSLSLLEDELANWAAGLSAPPTEYPWQAHARGLVGHLVYGLAADTLVRALKQTFASRFEQGDGRSRAPEPTGARGRRAMAGAPIARLPS